jgi:hypothetical protein
VLNRKRLRPLPQRLAKLPRILAACCADPPVFLRFLIVA